jgi:hypothetical protein
MARGNTEDRCTTKSITLRDQLLRRRRRIDIGQRIFDKPIQNTTMDGLLQLRTERTLQEELSSTTETNKPETKLEPAIQ